MQKQAKEPHLPKRRDKRRYDKIKVSRPTYDYILNEINIFYIFFSFQKYAHVQQNRKLRTSVIYENHQLA